MLPAHMAPTSQCKASKYKMLRDDYIIHAAPFDLLCDGLHQILENCREANVNATTTLLANS